MADQHLTTSEEIWKPIPDFPGYEVSDHGRVRSYWKITPIGRGKGTKSTIELSPQRIVKSCVYFKKYLTIGLWKDRKHTTIAIHTLVLEVFVGPAKKGEVCRHLDGNRLNNRRINLCWGTYKENSLDRLKHGTMYFGTNLYNTKLTDEQVSEIRKMAQDGHCNKEIAAIFKVGRGHIASIIRGRRRAAKTYLYPIQEA
jgi:hypothetical protein